MRQLPGRTLLAAILGACVVALLGGGLSAVEGPETVVHAEHGPRRVAAYRASPAADGAGIGWSLSGPDSGAFAIDDGVSRFPVPPDYESPSDAD